MPPSRVVTMSVALAGAGFLMFWLPRSPLLAEAGLFVTGLGVASLYPMILSLALATAPESAVEAGARLTLASGTAILALPLVLGRLADAAGIGPAYAIIPVLLSGAFLIIEFTSRRPLAPAATVEG
jgi:fucose permease